MEQYVKKSAIAAEIRKYIKSAEAFLKYHHNRNDKSVYAFEQEKLVMCDLLSFIDTLEVKEESVSEELEEAAKERVDAEDYGYVDEDGMPLYDSGYLEYMFKEGAKWQLAKIKSITLDDLEEFINELSKQFPEVSFAKVCKIATRTTKWLLDVELPKLEED